MGKQAEESYEKALKNRVDIYWVEIVYIMNERGLIMKRKYSQDEVERHMLGRIYINRDDLNIFVRRKGLYAWTMNLGNKWSWIITGSIAVIINIILFILL